MQILFSNKKSKKNSIKYFFEKKNPLVDRNIDEIIDVFNEISYYWVSKKFKLKGIFINNSMGFIIPWLKRENTLKLLNLNFNNYKSLNDPVLNNDQKLKIFARPQGTALHWLAGNVPVISLISLFQGILTKNKNIIKVSKSYKKILPQIFEDLKKNIKVSKEIKRTFLDILNSILIIYVEHDDELNLNFLSKNSDVRIIWGGKESVTKISSLPKKINCKDIIFGPKVSMAYISKNKLRDQKNLKQFSELFVNDVFNFDQLGCNSPHNLFIEKGSKYKLTEISKEISNTFKNKLKKIKTNTDPVNKYNILVKNFIHSLEKNNKVSRDKNFEWNIFINSKAKAEDPLYNRSIFISSVNNIKQLSNLLPNNTQSVGLYVEKNEKNKIVKNLSYNGVDRFPDIGLMSLYTNPWDGYLPMQNMVRWISY